MSLDIWLEDVGVATGTTIQIFDRNITHNLGAMAKACGIYDCLWRPGEHGIETAGQMIEPLRAGYAKLLAEPGEMRNHDSPNGWGIYDHFVPFVADVLRACEEYPGARVRVSV
jgi:hypothetical protein